MIYDLVHYKDPILYTKAEPFDFTNPPTDPIQLAKDLAETCIAKNGLGLAANQVGLPYNVFVIKSETVLACFNPKIVDVSSETVLLDEGCLSFPDIFVRVRRPKTIKVRYTRPNGETVTEKFTGLTARIFLHEYRHLEARTMLDDCSIIQKEKALKEIKKKKRRNG